MICTGLHGAYITYVRGSMSTLQILLFPCFYSVWSPTLSREEPIFLKLLQFATRAIGLNQRDDESSFLSSLRHV